LASIGIERCERCALFVAVVNNTMFNQVVTFIQLFAIQVVVEEGAR
jgi:hypothetical protein